MRAVGVREHGGPEALEVVELPDPSPGPGEVLVRVHAATVNPTDTYVRNGARAEHQRKDPPPYVPGMDVAGVLAGIGEGTVTDLSVGDRVMGIVVPDGAHGAYAELVSLPAGSVARAPAGTSHAEASTLPMNGLTARLALDMLGLDAGQTLAVTGAAGALGGYVVELGKADGLRVVADASEADEELVRSLGADVVVRRGDGVADRIVEAAGGPVPGLVDGSVQNEALFPAVADGGGFATVRGFRAEAPRGITLHQVWVRQYAEEQAKLDRLRQQVEEGQVTLRVAQTFPAEQAPEAHRLLEAGGVRGRLVIQL
jgi:NADPH:quinone reductase